jgi:hypothetical protein
MAAFEFVKRGREWQLPRNLFYAGGHLMSTAKACAMAGARATLGGAWLALALCACGPASEPAPVAFPTAPSGRLTISYPLDETLFPPEIVAPTFIWSDETEGVARWQVLVRFGAADEVLRFPTAEPRWRPSPCRGTARSRRPRRPRDLDCRLRHR